MKQTISKEHKMRELRGVFQSLCNHFPHLSISVTSAETDTLHITDVDGLEHSLDLPKTSSAIGNTHEAIFAVKELLKLYDA